MQKGLALVDIGSSLVGVHTTAQMSVLFLVCAAFGALSVSPHVTFINGFHESSHKLIGM